MTLTAAAQRVAECGMIPDLGGGVVIRVRITTRVFEHDCTIFLARLLQLPLS